MRHLQKIGFFLFCAPLITFSALAAEPYPVRPVKIIAPQAPGGGVDIVGRIIADQLRIATGQSFLIDNQAGAGGAIAAKMTARAAPDGYTLMIGYVATHGTNPAVKKGIYDPIKDFTAIGMIGGTPNILVASKSVPVKTLQEFVAYAKANPSKADYGTSGVGTLNHLLMEEFKTASGIPSMAVPYRSIGQAFTDSIGGQIQVIFPGLSAAMPHIREGSFKPLAITGEKRNPLMPNVPTFKESGYEGFNSLTWYGIVGPPGLPIAIRDQLNKTLAQILAKPEVQKSLADQAIIIMPMTPDRFEKYITAEVKHWTEVARVSKVEAD